MGNEGVAVPVAPHGGTRSIPPHPMSSTSRNAGRCPHCEASIPAGRILIEYETAGRLAAYADCPECGDVVSPA